MPSKAPSQEADERITLAIKINNKKLDLSGLSLSTVPRRLRELQNLTSLNLSRNSFTDVPTEILGLPSLTTLNLSHNQLSALPADLRKLSALTSLNIEKNRFSSLPLEVWSLPALNSIRIDEAFNLTDAQELDLSNIDLEIDPPLLANCKNLRRLNLSNNKLASLGSHFTSLKKIEYLDLRGNLFDKIPPEVWGLPELRDLEIDGNLSPEHIIAIDISNLGLEKIPCVIDKFRALRELDLGGNKLADLPIEILQIPYLERLNLSKNRLRTLPREFGNLTFLRWLNLQGNSIWPPPDILWSIRSLETLVVDVPLGHTSVLDLSQKGLTELPPSIGGLKGIRALKLGKNQLSTIPQEIGYLTDLEELDVEGNTLTRLPPSIERLNRLRTLNLKDNKLPRLPAEIGKLASLTTLNISSNNLSEIPPELCNLASLSSLNLEGNALSSLPSTIGKLQQLTRLNLRGNTLTELPPQIGQLSKLTWLNLETNKLHFLPTELLGLQELKEINLRSNRFTQMPTILGRLKELNALRIDSNLLTTLPEEISWLKNLTTFTCQSNQLTKLPDDIGTLTRLTDLNLSNNLLKALPATVSTLRSLVSLDLSANKLSALPPEIGGLRHLSVLNLQSNELTSVPGTLGVLTNLSHLDLSRNRIENLPAELGKLRGLQSFSIADNPLKDSLALVANRSTTSLLSYLRSLLKDGIPLYEAKLVLVGEGNVGKTSLLAALLNKPFIEGRPTTHGIEINPLELPHPFLDEKMTLNVWDFGGQPVYRISHQFFLSQRSLYIIAWSPREGPEKNDVEGWFERIKIRAGDQAMVLVVATHCDTGQRIARIEEEYFRRRYGNMIAGFHEIDSLTGRGLEKLKEALALAASQLPQMGDRLSLKWKGARDEILRITDPQITSSVFRAICTRYEMEEEETRILASLLHDLGHVVYFDDDENLNKLIVLQPEWLTKAIGFVLEDEATNKAFGVLEHHRLAEIWYTHEIPHREHYLPQCHPFFLRLMEKFDVSYRLENGHSSLIAQLVPAVATFPTWAEELPHALTQLKLVCLLSVRPPGLIPWLIVRTHRYTTGRHWLRGMFLELLPHGEALLELQERELHMIVRGSNPAHFMSILSDTFEHLVRQRWPGLEYRLAVPCPQKVDGAPCTGRLKLDILLKRRANLQATMTCPDCGDDLDIHHVLTGFSSFAQDTKDPKSRIETIKELLADEYNSTDKLGTKGAESVVDHKSIDPGHASRASQMLRSVLQALRAETKDYPPLFTLVPEEPTIWSVINFNRVRHRLTLWCQYPDCEHPVSSIGGEGPGEYVFRRQQRWFLKIAPYALLVSRMLRTVAPLAGVHVKETLDETLFHNAVLSLDRMEVVTAELLELAPEDLIDTTGVDRPVTKDEFAAVRQYHELLRTLDPAGKWGGLKRVETPTGDFAWLCPKHYRIYEPGLPNLGARRADQFDVFLSHNSKDKSAVIDIGNALKARGLHVWLDIWELKPGALWQDSLEYIIETARSVLVIIGRDGFGPWEQPEMRACIAEFVRRRMPVIPVLLPGVEKEPQLPVFLRQFSWVDLREGISHEGLWMLEWGITGIKPAMS